MKKLVITFIVFVFFLSGCTINISQPVTPIPSPMLDVNFATATPISVQNPTATPPYPTINIPITWSNLNLTGRLVYINALTSGNNNPVLTLNILNLATGGVTPIFQGPDLSWIYYASVSPDDNLLLMSYSVPAPNHGPVNQNLYILQLDGSKPPQMVISPPTPYDQYVQAEWSPDGRYIYYAHFNYQNQSNEEHYPHYEIYRMTYPTGQPEKVADEAFWPRLSADGSHLVYISMDPITGKNKIYVANADGSNAQEVILSGAWTPDIIDAPLFSPDGQSIIFSAFIPQQTSVPTWIEKILGIQIAEAHSIPSDWWSVPITGGVVTRLTSLRTTGLFGSISPDRRLIASYSGGGLFVMNPDGTNLTLLIPDTGGIIGTVSWIP